MRLDVTCASVTFQAHLVKIAFVVRRVKERRRGDERGFERRTGRSAANAAVQAGAVERRRSLRPLRVPQRLILTEKKPHNDKICLDFCRVRYLKLPR